MIAIRRRLGLPRRSDSGLSLIEVVVAVVIVSIVALASAGLGIQGISTSTAQQRQQVAVTIANSAMEAVSAANISINTYATPSVSGFYTGRDQASVNAAFTAQAGQPGVAQTYAAWDPNPAVTAATVEALPIVSTPSATTTNGTAYTVTTLIGPCYELSLQSSWPASGPLCTELTGQSTPPTTVPAGYTQMIRAIVVVNWTAGKTCSGAGGCNYTISTLFAPQDDPEWITGG